MPGRLNGSRLPNLLCAGLLFISAGCRDAPPAAQSATPDGGPDAAARPKRADAFSVVHRCSHARNGSALQLSFLLRFKLEGHSVDLDESGEPVAVSPLEHAESAIRVDCEAESGRWLCSGARLLGLDRLASTHSLTASELVTISIVDVADRTAALARAREELAFLEDQLREAGARAVATVTDHRVLVERTLEALATEAAEGGLESGFLIETSDQLLFAVDLRRESVTILTTGTDWLASARVPCTGTH